MLKVIQPRSKMGRTLSSHLKVKGKISWKGIDPMAPAKYFPEPDSQPREWHLDLLPPLDDMQEEHENDDGRLCVGPIDTSRLETSQLKFHGLGDAPAPALSIDEVDTDLDDDDEVMILDDEKTLMMRGKDLPPAPVPSEPVMKKLCGPVDFSQEVEKHKVLRRSNASACLGLDV